MPFLTKEQIVSSITSIEGGYVNNPNDSGGETNHGITKKVAVLYTTQLKKLFNWDGTMKNFTKPMASYVYDHEYWLKLKLDRIHPISSLLADKLFDIGVNCGVERAGTWLQEILNVSNSRGKHWPDLKADGIIGTVTVNAINSFVAKRGKNGAIRTLVKGLIADQTHHYKDMSLKYEKNEDFYYGWLARTDHNLDLYFSATSGK